MTEQNPPNYIPTSILMGPLKYKWSADIALKAVAAKDQNARLYDAIDACNFRAKMTVGIGLSEIIGWRFAEASNAPDYRNRVEAGWACLINPPLLNDVPTVGGIDDATQPAEGIVDTAAKILRMITRRFTSRSIYLAEQIVRQAMLAKQVIPDKKGLEQWLTETLRRFAKEFPNKATYDEETEVYDYMTETLVFRDCLDPQFACSDVNVRAAMNRFLAAIGASNPYIKVAAS